MFLYFCFCAEKAKLKGDVAHHHELVHYRPIMLFELVVEF